MKIYPKQFSRLLYYGHLEVVYLFDTMHIRKNVTKPLWKKLDGRSVKEKNSRFVTILRKPIMQCD